MYMYLSLDVFVTSKMLTKMNKPSQENLNYFVIC